MSKFNLKTAEFKNFDLSDGLQSNEFNEGAYLKSRKGEMFFGGINGFNRFHPDSIRENSHIPPVVITDFKILNRMVPIGKDSDNKSILKSSIIETEEIRLSYKHNVFSFEFAALDYTIPEKNIYAYKLEDLTEEWNYVDADRRYVSYNSLPGGEYVFRVKGTNNDGVWNEEGVTIKITVTPPYWKTLRFKFFAFISLAGFSSGIVFWRMRDLKKRNILLKKEVHFRTNELEVKSNKLEIRLNELQESSLHIKRLEGFLPICCCCKKISPKGADQDDQDTWIQIEKYITDRTDTDFSHTICPECKNKLYPDT